MRARMLLGQCRTASYDSNKLSWTVGIRNLLYCQANSGNSMPIPLHPASAPSNPNDHLLALPQPRSNRFAECEPLDLVLG